ncbi:MAG TPA: PKD domain-containing protein, partial [Anaerolineae bacterium]|nr:PKD domain-containing protein [Anaerolineae bacterium]
NQFGVSTAKQAVAVGASPTAIFTYTPPPSFNYPIVISFTNLSTGTAPITYTWNFGDGSPSQSTGTLLLPVQHTYPKGGNYTVTLTASNRYGDSVAHQLIALPLSPTAKFTHTTPVFAGLPTTFTNLTTGTLPITFTWNFGDGSLPDTGTLALPVIHTYLATGTYTVILTAGNSAGNNVFSNTFTALSVYQVYLPVVLK